MQNSTKLLEAEEEVVVVGEEVGETVAGPVQEVLAVAAAKVEGVEVALLTIADDPLPESPAINNEEKAERWLSALPGDVSNSQI